MPQDMHEHQQRAARLEALIQEVAAFPDAQARATTEELIQTLLDMYGEGLARILDLTAQSEAPGLIEMLANDDLVSSLFLLHGLHPIAIETRIARALVEVRPYLKSQGGSVELVKIENGIAYVRLEENCHSCSASTVNLKSVIEEAIYQAVPDLDELKIEGLTDPPPRQAIPMTFVPPKRRKDTLVR